MTSSADFELAFDWKISPGGNSGCLKYNVSEEVPMANAPNHAALGFRLPGPRRQACQGQVDSVAPRGWSCTVSSTAGGQVSSRRANGTARG